MIELDTNVIVRYLSKDDEQQTEVATQLIMQNECLLLQTVLLETVWVLGSKRGHAWSREQIAENLKHLLGLPTLALQGLEQMYQTLRWYEAGMDFADALHLANSTSQFATFDRHLANKAAELNAPTKIIFLGQQAH
ncbi:type II toxin-antitoxin system VapC family toxin [Thiolinea disciformis]|uniref:type II toxin-antitoxin system VapC family toxin n=1 Tax=Thiolinea disciformis TaxID=125614 RepID=UPI00037DDB0B|nr:type II toxin-antitoxin system VapC family toxin [Thiolinea disciformis]